MSVTDAPATYWGDYMTGDDGVQRFPFLRRRGDVALIALSSGLPTGPFMATGRLGERQLARLLAIGKSSPKFCQSPRGIDGSFSPLRPQRR